jgi:hypothetical protein
LNNLLSFNLCQAHLLNKTGLVILFLVERFLNFFVFDSYSFENFALSDTSWVEAFDFSLELYVKHFYNFIIGNGNLSLSNLPAETSDYVARSPISASSPLFQLWYCKPHSTQQKGSFFSRYLWAVLRTKGTIQD